MAGARNSGDQPEAGLAGSWVKTFKRVIIGSPGMLIIIGKILRRRSIGQ